MSSSSATTGSITEGTRVLKCPLLTAHNWTLWKHRMTNHLRAQQLWDVVDPTTATEKSASTQKSASDTTRETRAAEKAAAAAVAASTDDVLRAAKALDLIESHISEDLLSMLLSMNDPREVWIFLTQRFEANSIAHQCASQLQFQSLRLPSGQTINSYITEANNLCFRLSSVGINLSCLQLIDQVEDGLPRWYNQLASAKINPEPEARAPRPDASDVVFPSSASTASGRHSQRRLRPDVTSDLTHIPPPPHITGSSPHPYLTS